MAMEITPPYAYSAIVPLTKSHKVKLPEAGTVPAPFRDVTGLPLSFAEFGFAARDYPIAFVSGDGGKTFVAMAILGMENKQNLFLQPDQSWEAGMYVPAYVRRYPFCMTRVTLDGKEQPDRIACVEKSAIDDNGEALHDDKGEALPSWEEHRKLLFEFETDLARTEEFCRTIKELDLLEPFNVQATPSKGAPLALTGIYRVAEQKLNDLPADKLKELLRNGVIARIYAHLFSLTNFGRLLDRRAATGAAAASAPPAKAGGKKPA